jgi:hypothetical protein
LTRKRPRPGSETAKSISSSRWKYSICSGVISPKAAWRTVSGRQDLLVDREDLAFDLDLDRGVRREEQVRGAASRPSA